MNTGQIQVRLTLTDQLYTFLQARAARLGLPVTQVVKHMIVKEAEKEEFPTFPASSMAEQKFEHAQANLGDFVKVEDVKKYLDSL
jgi:hypothetical protein